MNAISNRQRIAIAHADTRPSGNADVAANDHDPWTTSPPPAPESVLPARVVFLTHYIPPYQVRVLQEIASRVVDFHVLLSTPIEPNRSFEIDWGDLDVSIQKTVTLKRLWKHRGPDTQTSFVDPLYVHFPYDTMSRLKKLKPDFVMSVELGARSLGAIRYCRTTPGAKSLLCTYMIEHTELNRGWMRERLRRYLINRADAITYNGPSCQRYLTRLGASPNKLYRLGYAADDRTFLRGPAQIDTPETQTRLLYVGQLSDRKGVLPMISQLAAYCTRRPNQSIQLRLAGEGPLRQTIQQMARPTNLELKLLGNVPSSELRQEMARCGATIASTLADEWLMVVNESLHAGLPVIGSQYAQATTTLIRDGENGWIYSPDDDDSLFTALDDYFSLSTVELGAMRQRCRKSIEHCTPRWAADGAIRAIGELMGEETSKREVFSQ